MRIDWTKRNIEIDVLIKAFDAYLNTRKVEINMVKETKRNIVQWWRTMQFLSYLYGTVNFVQFIGMENRRWSIFFYHLSPFCYVMNDYFPLVRPCWTKTKWSTFDRNMGHNDNDGIDFQLTKFRIDESKADLSLLVEITGKEVLFVVDALHVCHNFVRDKW